MSVYDLRSSNSVDGRVLVCYLVDEAKRITSNTFNVWIPALMGSIDNSKKNFNESISTKYINESGRRPSSIKMQGYIQAFNKTAYTYRLDGFIPHFHANKMTMAKGTASKYAGNLSGPTTPAGCGPHTHNTTGNHTYSGINMETMEYTDINIYWSEGVDFQNLNNKVIKRGHKMYGVFAEGEQNTFIIIGIDNVTPRLDSTSNDSNADRVDNVTNDGSKNPVNKT